MFHEQTQELPSFQPFISEDSGIIPSLNLPFLQIFGPVLPVITYSNLPDLLDTLKRREKPLVTYFFSTHRPSIEAVERELSSGTLSINDTITFVCIPELPFGGVGNSGQGEYLWGCRKQRTG